jgi:hypothetical protein
MMFAAALAAPLTPPLVAHARVELSDDVVHLADVVDLTALPLPRRRAVAQRVVARLPAGRRSIMMSRAGLSLLVRRAVPGLVPTIGGAAPILLAIRGQRGAEPRDDCAVAASAVTAGIALTYDMVSPATCRDESVTAVMFDRRAGVAIAKHDLAAGAYLGRLIAAKTAGVRKGMQVNLVSSAGPVRVERLVTAMQDGRGRRVFVRDEDGQVFSARLGALTLGDAQ